MRETPSWNVSRGRALREISRSGRGRLGPLSSSRAFVGSESDRGRRNASFLGSNKSTRGTIPWVGMGARCLKGLGVVLDLRSGICSGAVRCAFGYSGISNGSLEGGSLWATPDPISVLNRTSPNNTRRCDRPGPMPLSFSAMISSSEPLCERFSDGLGGARVELDRFVEVGTGSGTLRRDRSYMSRSRAPMQIASTTAHFSLLEGDSGRLDDL